jgi:hypothetical protein
MRRAARTDANHGQIIAALRQMGYTVLDLSRLGQGCPDLLVARHGITTLVEVKDGTKPPSARRLTPMESAFIQHWKGRVIVIASVDDVFKWFA